MAYNPVDVESLKDSVDIVSVIGRYVELKKAGSSWKGLCPFHREKTPSFFVSPERGTWKCFGCDSGGDVISFLQRYNGLDFIEVVEMLAEEYGISLKLTGDNRSREKRSSLHRLVEESQKFYSSMFRDSPGSQAREYLEKRGIDENLLGLGVGYAPPGNALMKHLQGHGWSVSTMEEAGLVRTGDRDPYDFFRNRLTFPIRDRRGRVVSFGARALGEARAKYLNGPETQIYRKGTFLYGYSRAQKHAGKQNRVILVEGYFDHARLLSLGFEETVAASGTAFTETQARNLMGMADRILICCDGDPAGRKASVKVARTIMAQGGFPEIVKIPDGLDPDDFAGKHGGPGFESLLESAMDPVTFCISLLDSQPGTGYRRVLVAQKLLEVASSASNPLVEEELLLKVEKFTGFSRTALLRSTSEKESGGQEKKRIPSSRKWISSGDKTLLRAATAGNMLQREYIRFLQAGDMRSPAAERILEALKSQVEEGYSRFMPGEMDPETADLCLDIAGVLDSVTGMELKMLKHSVERTRRESSRKKGLLAELSTADPEREAEILEDLRDSR